jgi:hypothetical protein
MLAASFLAMKPLGVIGNFLEEGGLLYHRMGVFMPDDYNDEPEPVAEVQPALASLSVSTPE